MNILPATHKNERSRPFQLSIICVDNQFKTLNIVQTLEYRRDLQFKSSKWLKIKVSKKAIKQKSHVFCQLANRIFEKGDKYEWILGRMWNVFKKSSKKRTDTWISGFSYIDDLVFGRNLSWLWVWGVRRTLRSEIWIF